jgi:drug/metabolite transporter (DMT)-like permease
MSWIAIAIIGHLANGFAFVIDKILLRSAFSRSATYAGLVGLLSTFVLVLAPFAPRWPVGSGWVVALASGSTFIFALWAFFAALARAEASRVVPIIGSLIPMLTLVGTYLFLNERLTDQTFIGFILLILATMLLSSGGKGKLDKGTLLIAIISAFLFAVASVTGKATYDASGFLGGFITTRIAAAVTSLFILLVLDRQAGLELRSLIQPQEHSTKNHRQPGRMAGLLALIGQTLGATGFLLVQWGTALGSASIVNALQAVQYALLVIVGIALYKKAPQLLGEELSRKTLIVKTAALLLTALGMYFVV